MDEKNLTFTLYKEFKPLNNSEYELLYYKFSITKFIRDSQSVKRELKTKKYYKKNIKDTSKECKLINDKEIFRIYKNLNEWNVRYDNTKTRTNEIRVNYLNELLDLYKTWYDGQGLSFPLKFKKLKQIDNNKSNSKILRNRFDNDEGVKIFIAAALDNDTYPEKPTLAKLKIKSGKMLEGKAYSESTWCRHLKSINFLALLVKQMSSMQKSGRTTEVTKDKYDNLKEIVSGMMGNLNREESLKSEKKDIYKKRDRISYDEKVKLEVDELFKEYND